MTQAKRFEHYEVLEKEDGSLWELGRGAMGVTYKAMDTDLHCTVALKVINPAILDAEGTQHRFLREARAAAQLRHPNIATVLRLGKTTDETHFYAMEFCDGNTLEQFVAKEGPLKIELALEFTLQVTKALVAAEEHHVVHRDIKPANLIISKRRGEGFVVKVIDFGLAKSVAGSANAWTSMSLATAGFIGTAHFSSPEQLEEGEVDTRSDIYSLGATLWYMLAGKPMFKGSVARVMSQHLSALPPWDELDSCKLPEAVRKLLANMLAKNPNDRPQSALELKEQVQSCLDKLRSKKSLADNRKKAQERFPTDVLNNRWKPIQECGRNAGGKLYRGVDLAKDGQLVAITLLDEALCENKAYWKQLDEAVRSLADSGDGLVHPIKLDRDENARPFLVTEWLNQVPLIRLLRRRGFLALSEVLHLLNDLAPVFDYVVARQIRCGPFSKEQVTLAFAETVSVEKEFDALTQKPLAEWPDVHAAIDLLPLDANDSLADQTLLSMRTILPGGSAGATSDVPSLQQFGLLAYALLGGTARSGTQRYVPVARLTADGNSLLKSVIAPAEAQTTSTAVQFLDQLRKTAGFEPAWKSPAVVPIGTRPSRLRPQSYDLNRIDFKDRLVEKLQFLQRLIWYSNKKHSIVAAGCVVALGLLFWLWLSPGQDDRQESVAAPPVAPAPPAATPQPTQRAEFAGTVLSTRLSPKGDIRVEHRSGGSIYLVARGDESKRFLFPTYTNDIDEVLFSPDENWLVLNKGPHRNDGSSQLYYRVRTSDVEYAEPSEVSSGKSITDALWLFYLNEVGLPNTTSRYEVGITGMKWQSDSMALRFRLDNFGPDGRKLVPQAYECNYNVQNKRFSSITDTASIRVAINNSSQPSNPIVAPTPVPSPASTPQMTPMVSSAETPSASAAVVAFQGEQYPQTRTSVLTAADLQTWSPDRLQYAINEIFARRGAAFPDKKVQKTFEQFPWYHPQPGLTFDQIEGSLPDVERQNLQLLGNIRDAKNAGQNVAAGPWYGILYWKDGTFNKEELIFNPTLTEVRNRASNYQGASNWGSCPVSKKGKNLNWHMPANKGMMKYVTLESDPSGQYASVVCEIVDRGKVLYSATGTFGRNDVPFPVQSAPTPDPAAQIIGPLLQGISGALQEAASRRRP